MKFEKKIYTEIYTVISRLQKKDLNKIPEEIRDEIYNNADKEYKYAIKDLDNLSKAIIFEIIRKYISNNELREKMNEYIEFINE